MSRRQRRVVDGVGGVGEGLWLVSMCVSFTLVWWFDGCPGDVGETVHKSGDDGFSDTGPK